MVRVKICGITSLADARAAVDAGADYLGFMLAKSPRRVTPEVVKSIVSELPSTVLTVGVFVDEDLAAVRAIVQGCGLHLVQLHGEESPGFVRELEPSRVWKALRIRREEDLEPIAGFATHVEGIMLDAYSPGLAGGTGHSFDWSLAHNASRFGVPVILAGGLNPENVGRAIRQVRPDVVDVSSGVESSPGRKDPALVRAFVRAVRFENERTAE